MQQITAATNLANQNSNLIKIQGQYWNGAASATDEWDIQDVLGAGTNPTSSLQVSHSGSSGAALLSVPGSTNIGTNLTVGGTLGVTGLTTLSTAAFTLQGLNPTTGIPSLKSGNTAINAQQVGFPTEAPLFQQFLENNSNIFYANPQVYLSRVDQTVYTAPGATPGVGSCLNTGPLASCDQPIMLVTGTNQNTGNIPGMVGVEVNLWGFKANGASPPIFANYIAGVGVNVSDTATDNLTNLRGGNFIANVFGTPTHTGPGGFTRSAGGVEIDVASASGADGVFSVSGGTGNFIFGQSLILTSNNSGTEALSINSSAAVNGKGWLDGIEMGGIVNCGICIYKGGPGSFSPTIGQQIATGGTYGLVIGAGTIDTPKSTASNSNANPTNGIVLDASGTAGNSETVNSNVLVLRAKNASSSGTDWQVQHIAGNSLQFTLIGAASYFKFGNTGNFTLSGTAGQHINTFSANNDTDGVVAVSASTSGAHNFSVAYASAPSCTLTPTSDPTTVGVWWVTTSTGAVTANIKVSGSINFMYHCVGNPN
jgi:hypothetical protein